MVAERLIAGISIFVGCSTTAAIASVLVAGAFSDRSVTTGVSASTGAALGRRSNRPSTATERKNMQDERTRKLHLFVYANLPARMSRTVRSMIRFVYISSY